MCAQLVLTVCAPFTFVFDLIERGFVSVHKFTLKKNFENYSEVHSLVNVLSRYLN